MAEFIPGSVYMAIMGLKDPSKPYLELPVMLIDIIDDAGIAEVVGFNVNIMAWDDEERSFLIHLDNISHDRGRAFEFIEQARWLLHEE